MRGEGSEFILPTVPQKLHWQQPSASLILAPSSRGLFTMKGQEYRAATYLAPSLWSYLNKIELSISPNFLFGQKGLQGVERSKHCLWGFFS